MYLPSSVGMTIAEYAEIVRREVEALAQRNKRLSEENEILRKRCDYYEKNYVPNTQPKVART